MRSAAAPQLIVVKSGLNFGDVWEDTAFRWTLQVRNSSPEDITIENFSHSCSCAKIEPGSLIIPAGASSDLRLTIDLTDKPGTPSELLRPFSIRLWPNFATPQQTRQEWTITGRVRTPILFERSWLDFGRQSECEQPIPAQRVAIKTLVPLQQLVVSCSKPEFRALASRRKDDPSTFDLEVSQSSNLPSGPVRFDVVVTPELQGGKRLSEKRLPAIGFVIPDLQVSPPVGMFGARQVGETVEETVTLYSLTGRKFIVSEMRVGGAGASVRPIQVVNGDPTYEIVQRITMEGEHQSSVVFVARLNDRVEEEIKFNVSYRGLPKAGVGQ